MIYFYWPATILSIWWDSNRLSMSNFSGRGPGWNRQGPYLYIFWTSQLLEVGRAGSKTGGVHGAKILSRFFLLHCSRIVLRSLPLVRTWMFVCFVCSLCLLPPPFPMLMSCQKSWRCNSCGKATTKGVKFVFSFFVVVLIKIWSKWEAFSLGRCYVLRT